MRSLTTWPGRALLRVRSYRNGDRARILKVWSSAYDRYAGHVTRTPSYWEWAIRERPGVTDDDILVAEWRGRLMGYGVLGPGGKVLEFAIDPSLSGWLRRIVARVLVTALEQRARVSQCDAIYFRLPDGDAAQIAVLRSRAYVPDPSEHLQWVLLDLVELISSMLRHRWDQVPPEWERSFGFELEPGNYQFAPYRHLLIKLSAAGSSVERRTHDAPMPHDATMVSTTVDTLADLILQKTRLDDELSHGRVFVNPDLAVKDVAKLLSLIRVTEPWFTPLADYR